MNSPGFDGEDFAAARFVHAVRDHQGLVDDPAAGADLLDLGVEEQVPVAALQRPRAERFKVLVQRCADCVEFDRQIHAG
jgi:hypothetical protein